MSTNNSINSTYANNADGFSLTGGTTPRTLLLTAGNVSLSAGGSNTYTMPAATDTLVGRASTDTLTNKSISGSTNTLTNVGPAARTGGFFIGTLSGASVLNTTGNKVITGVGFTPKLVLFRGLFGASSTGANEASGGMTAAAQFYATSGSNTAATTAFARNASSSACIGFVSAGSSTPTLLGAYVSMDADGFTINISTASSAVDFSYTAYA